MCRNYVDSTGEEEERVRWCGIFEERKVKQFSFLYPLGKGREVEEPNYVFAH